jgi:hypothetical protein
MLFSRACMDEGVVMVGDGVVGVRVMSESDVHETAVRKASFNAWVGIARGDEVS